MLCFLWVSVRLALCSIASSLCILLWLWLPPLQKFAFLLCCCLLLCCFSLSAFGCCSFCSCFRLTVLSCCAHATPAACFKPSVKNLIIGLLKPENAAGAVGQQETKQAITNVLNSFPNAFKPMGGGGFLPWTTSDKTCTTLLMLMMLATCAQHHQHHRVVASRFLLCISILRSPLLAFSYVGLGVCVSRSHCCLTSAR